MASPYFDAPEDKGVAGSHIAKGTAAYGRSYQDAIINQQARNKNLKWPDWKIPLTKEKFEPESRVRLLTFDDEGIWIDQPALSDELTLPQISDILKNDQISPGPNGSMVSITSMNRLYVLQGLNPEFVELFGNHFDIDPAIFLRHQRTALWEAPHRAGNTPYLASVENPTKSFMIEYCELRYFHEDPRKPSLRNPADMRHINFSQMPHFSRDIDRVGVMHRKASFWSNRRPIPLVGWDGR
jgi:hypothetical protein